MALKRFSGSKNLKIDLGISFLISFFLYVVMGKAGPELPEMIGATIGGTIGAFFLFFIWSWRREHVQQNKSVAYSIHALCLTMLAISAITIFVCLPHGAISMIFPSIWSIGIAIKYKSLFWPKKTAKNTPTLDQTCNE